MLHIVNEFIVQLIAHLKTVNKMDECIRNSKSESNGEFRRELRNRILSNMIQLEHIRTLDERMWYFNILYHDKNFSLNTVKEAVKRELSGLRKLLGYKAMHLKIRQKNRLNVTRDQVYVMTDVDLEGLKQRLSRYFNVSYIRVHRYSHSKTFISEGFDFQ